MLQVKTRLARHTMTIPVQVPGRPRRYVRRTIHSTGRITIRIGRKAARRGWARRRPLAPLYTATVTLAAGAVVSTLPGGANTATVLTAAGALALTYRGARARRVPDRLGPTRHTWATLAACGTWTTVAGIVGVSPWPMRAALVVGTAALGVPWWQRHRVRPDTGGPVDMEWRNPWLQHVSDSHGALPGSYLVDMETVRHGWTATIVGRRGTHTIDILQTATPRIASAYGLPATSVIVEAHPSRSAHLGTLIILPINPLTAPVPFPGPTVDDDGWCRIGQHATGHPARWRLWQPDSGLCHGLVFGTTGAGKSGLLNTLAAHITGWGRAHLIICDPQGGASLPAWTQHVTYARTPEEIRDTLRDLDALMDARQEEMAERAWTDKKGRPRVGIGHFNPTPEIPGVFALIDESPSVLSDPECAATVARILKQGRKVGVAVILVTQFPSVGETGGDGSIRSLASSMNVMMLRTGDRMSAQMASLQSVPVDPATLPQHWPDGSTTAGLGYLGHAGGRASVLRCDHIDDPYDYASTCAPVPIEARSQVAIDYQRHILAEARQLLTEAGGDPTVAKQMLGQGPAERLLVSNLGSESATVTGDTGPRIVTYLTGMDTDCASTRTIADAIGVSGDTARKALGRLAGRSQVVRVAPGMWSLPIEDAA